MIQSNEDHSALIALFCGGAHFHFQSELFKFRKKHYYTLGKHWCRNDSICHSVKRHIVFIFKGALYN